MTDYPSITCPRCGRVSYSQGDIDNKFCVVCGFHDDFGVPGLDDAKLRL